VSLRRVGNLAEIQVSDTGIGIRPEVLSDVFEKFRQGSGATTRRHGGLGLGLSITKHLVELHGGAVQAWSEGEGKGTTFTVELPLITAGSVEREDDPGSRGSVSAGSRVSTLENIKVLVVEDDRDTRDLVRRLLEAHRAEVIVAATAPEALDLLASTRPDILVSDIGLPDVDGYELMNRIRAMSDSLAKIPAVALTAFAKPDDRTRALRAGFNAHVAKPIEPEELIAMVGSFHNLISYNRKAS
jgi:CheY-like chemotaxis protein